MRAHGTLLDIAGAGPRMAHGEIARVPASGKNSVVGYFEFSFYSFSIHEQSVVYYLLGILVILPVILVVVGVACFPRGIVERFEFGLVAHGAVAFGRLADVFDSVHEVLALLFLVEQSGGVDFGDAVLSHRFVSQSRRLLAEFVHEFRRVGRA